MPSNLGQLRQRVRIKLQETTAQFYTDQEINESIGESYEYYSGILIETGEGYFQTVKFLGFQANIETVSVANLDPPFMEVAILSRCTSNGYIPLIWNPQRFTFNSTILSGQANAYIPKAKMRGTDIVLIPQPQSDEVPVVVSGNSQTGLKLEYEYIPTFPVFDSPDDFTFDEQFPSLFEPMVIIYTVISCLENKDAMGGVSDIQSFRGRLEKWEDRFMKSLSRTEYPDKVNYLGIDYVNMNNWRY